MNKKNHHLLLLFVLIEMTTSNMLATLSPSAHSSAETKQTALLQAWKVEEDEFNHILEKYNWTKTEINRLLSDAIERDYVSATKKLVLEMGADINMQNKFGFTPLYWAIQTQSSPEILHFLHHKGAQVEPDNLQPTNPWACLVVDTLMGDTHAVMSHIQPIPNRIRAKQERLYVLHLAAYAGHKELVISLRAYGFLPTAWNLQGQSPVHLAAYAGHKDIVMFLIKAGADINTQDAQGNTPLHYAAMQNQIDTIGSLVHAGANFIAENKHGITPLDYILDVRHDIRTALRGKLPETCVQTLCEMLPLDYVPSELDLPTTHTQMATVHSEKRPSKRQRRA